MKKVFFILFISFGVFAFGQSSCSCGDPQSDGCSSNCGAGKVAICEGYGSNCSCSCISVDPQNPNMGTEKNKDYNLANHNNLKVRSCPIVAVGRIEKMTNIKFETLKGNDNKYSPVYKSFINKISSNYYKKNIL